MLKQKGFGILEVFISLVVGLFLLVGVLATFSSMHSTAKQTSTYGQLQENGRLVISLLTDDLIRQGFWGGLSGNLSFSALDSVPNPIAADCRGEGVNNNSFPTNIGHFRQIWGDLVQDNDVLDCINNAKIGSDILQIKRVLSSPVANASLDSERYYLRTNMNSGTIFKPLDGIPVIDYANNWEYQHHIFYIREDNINGTQVPILVKGRLMNRAGDPIEFEMIVDGIEHIHFHYGVDTDNDGVVNAFIPSEDMLDSYWDNEGDTTILAVTMYVLVRDVYPDFDYENNNIYTLGSLVVNGGGDNYHRLLLSSTVTLYNARIDSW